MPAVRLTTPFAVERYDVVGSDAAGDDSFVRHVGLAAEPAAGPAVSIAHMKPPFEPRSSPTPIQTLGRVPLTEAEVLQIDLLINRVEEELAGVAAASQYTVRPAVVPVKDPDGTVIRRRYSCAGFVLEAYRAAGITLLDGDESRLPLVSLSMLQTAYPELSSLLADERFRARLNLPGDGPWPVVLPGYVMNALDRPGEVIRSQPAGYRPTAGDESFPPRSAAASPPQG